MLMLQTLKDRKTLCVHDLRNTHPPKKKKKQHCARAITILFGGQFLTVVGD